MVTERTPPTAAELRVWRANSQRRIDTLNPQLTKLDQRIIRLLDELESLRHEGLLPPDTPRPCPICNGAGEDHSHANECDPLCDGSHELNGRALCPRGPEQCESCHGTGVLLPDTPRAEPPLHKTLDRLHRVEKALDEVTELWEAEHHAHTATKIELERLRGLAVGGETSTDALIEQLGEDFYALTRDHDGTFVVTIWRPTRTAGNRIGVRGGSGSTPRDALLAAASQTKDA